MVKYLCCICIISDHKYTSYWIEKSTTKAIALVDKIDHMLQRQIKALCKQIEEIEEQLTQNMLSQVFIT